TERHHITGTQVHVVTEHEHAHRHLSDIVTILDESALSETAKEQSKQIFRRLAEAEAKVHGSTPEQVHFHEVGALDAIVDIVGAVVGAELLGVQEIYASTLRLGTGITKSMHGKIPVPAPATVELLRGVPVQHTDIRAELVTPTGAAILTTLAKGFGQAPLFRTEQIGYGAGTRELEDTPNLLRVQIGDTREDLEQDHSVLIETNVDDMTPEITGYVMDKLLSEGAKDVYVTPVMMKKGRPGMLLSVLTDPASATRISDVLFRETTTLGVRLSEVDRLKVHRCERTVDTAFGPVRIKVGCFGGREQAMPEFDDCARIAKERGVPILEVYRAAQAKAE
ncbi:MAG: nickel pincer cofactor biosynthesis protein LarC, partial [Candidatus Latescibacteria bacterium]|nr:nickel pincer cofactor biosynthesis protein LarC [Candidatus Latescibacterota bacterium]